MALTTLPYNGIEPTMVEPPSIDHLYPDLDVTVPVLLVIILAGDSSDSTDNHWMLTWTVFDDNELIVRRLQIVQETGYNHLTNWGPLTVTADDITKSSPQLSLGELTLSQRKVLEGIARETPVMMPNGEWNCQNWTTDVLKEAVKQNLLDNGIVDEVLVAAREVEADW
jgi:hypothetical protein